jgi:hypothetical protein
MFDVFYIGIKPNLLPHEREANSVEHAQELSRTRLCWVITYLADLDNWDFLWEPAPWQAEFVHVWPSDVEGYAAVQLVPKHVENFECHYHSTIVPSKARPENYQTLVDCEFNYNWSPNPFDPPFIYVFGNQHWPTEVMPTVTYTVPGATERKYMDWPTAQLKPCHDNWITLETVNEEAWDWSWRPDPGEPPYIYVWGNQWNPAEFKASLEYHVPGATERKYMDQRTQRRPNYSNQWRVLLSVEEFDYSWEPNPFDPAYIYVFGNQWYSAEVEPTVEYHAPGATERKYVHDIVARVQPNTTHYHQHGAVESFDYSWHPDPGEPPYIYVFGNQWHSAEIMPTVEYRVPGATERKYMSAPCAQLPERHTNHWHTIEDCDWDYSWVPDPGDPAYIYVFGNQWHSAEIMPTVTYTVPGATERKYMDMPRAVLPQDPNRPWYNVVSDCDWDYSWVPDPGEPPYIYVFGNQHWPAEKMPTIEYRVSGATEHKYMSHPCAELLPDVTHWTIPAGVDPKSMDLSWVPDPGEPPYIYQFGTQHQKTGGPVYTVPGATEVNYIDHPRAKKTSVDPNWTIPQGVAPHAFDWTWHSDATELPYIYQFATQHQKTGGPVYTVPGATETKYLENIEVKIESKTVPIIEIDHMDGNAGQIANIIKRVRYFDNYRDTLIRLAKSLVGEHEWVWVCSSICDYSGFDFSWHPERWQTTMLHVFASNEQKFGDTFYMHVPTFAERAEKKALLEWYSVNYVPRISVSRRAMPVIEHTADSHVDAVKTTDWAGPVALFTTNGVPLTVPAVPLWRQETKTVVPLSAGASAVVVPRTAKGSIETQLYDYPYIDKTQRKRHGDQPLSIVFVSNGEPHADHHYRLLKDSTYNRNNHVHRVDGVNGRVAAYHAAARASETPWFFAVFAKLEVDAKFDWTWQPDRMQQPKHYIFHAINPVNGLQYGHQAMIAYNRELVLNNPGLGLDFTLDSAHEVVPINSGTAQYNATPWMTWRTAFREVIKLCSSADVESQYRLTQWLATPRTNVENWAWSVWGAEDAVEYYKAVKGEPTELRKSYEWAWLSSYAFVKRSLTPDQ